MEIVKSFVLLLTYFGCVVVQRNEAGADNERKVKGQQHVSQTLVAKVVGPNGFSDHFLQILRNDSDIPFVVDNTTLVDGPNGTTSALVTENIKTTVTRITIPLSTSFMDSNWYRETLRKFLQKNRVALKNSTVEKKYDEHGPDMELIILKLWAAANLRDNIITVFGTLLFTSEKVLPGDLHSSLLHLYKQTRLRRISTIEFLDALEEMSFENPHEQFKILFQKFEKYTPKYLRSCVTYWLEFLHTNLVNVAEFLTNTEGVLIADFLSGIDNWAFFPIKQRVLFPKHTVMGSLPQNEELLGEMLSYTLSGITSKSITLTRELFGAILFHLPVNRLIPQVDEIQRLFIDFMKKDYISEEIFTEAVNKLNLVEFADPFDLVKGVFKSLLTVNEEYHELYETILVNIQPTKNTYALEDFDAMVPILNSQKLDMNVLLSSIVPEEYPPDIVDAKDRLLYYIDKSYIDLEFVLRGFVKYQSTTPTELLIAALTRIEIRSTNLSPELLSTVSSLKVYIIYKKILNDLRLNLSMVDVTTMLLSFQSPNIPKHVAQVSTELKDLLHSEFIHIDYQLNNQSTAYCTRPRQCVINVLKYLLAKNQVQNIICEAKIKEFLSLVDHNGEPIRAAQRSFTSDCFYNDYIVKKPSGRTGVGVTFRNESKDEKRNFTKEIYPGKYNPSPYKNDNFKMNLYEKPVFISRLDSGKVLITGQGHEIFFASERPEMTDLKFDRVSIPHPGWINSDFDVRKLLPILNDDETINMSPIETLLQKENLIEHLNINPLDYQTKGLLLKEVLTRSLKKVDLFESEYQRNFTASYLRLLEYTYAVLPPPPPMTFKHQKHEVNLITLLRAIPVPVNNNTMQRFNILKTLLTNADISWITNEIDPNIYPSKGLFLKRLLQLLLDRNIKKNKEITDCLRYFSDKVMMSGYGAQPIDWIIVMEKRQYESP